MRTRVWVGTTVVVGLGIGALAVAALVAWPKATLGTSDDALARVALPGFAGRVVAVTAQASDGTPVPVQLRRGSIWPLARLLQGEEITVDLTVRRPGWAGWLVGRTERRSFTVETPSVHLREGLLQVKAGAQVMVAFETPVNVASFGGAAARRISPPRSLVPVGIVARGAKTAGTIEVAAAARAWERLSLPVRVSWFPPRPYPQLLATPAPGTTLAPDTILTLSFSAPVSSVLGTAQPRLDPPTPGHWRQLDEHTLAFQPSGLGYGLGTDVQIELPHAVHQVGRTQAAPSRRLRWHVPGASPLRLEQLLAQLGYLPLDWVADLDPPTLSRHEQLAAALAPPSGRFFWRFPHTPVELRRLWRPDEPNAIVRAAVMMFEHDHGLAVDGLVGPRVWRTLLGDAIAGKRHPGGYSYVYVHRNVPQSLNLWHNGKVILRSPGNTGVPAAPTQLGTFPVFEHIPVGTMSGTNPDGTRYNDPGIRFISYFHHGEAIHSFTRASFGTPQSLGCVELPLAAAAKVWPYTPIGTLVTVED
jgi:hypothetical protein